MSIEDIPIRSKLMRVILITSGSVLVLTCSAYFIYEYYSSKHYSIRQISVLGDIIAANSTAALAFDSKEDAREILSSLQTQPNIIAACLYNTKGEIFTYYPNDAALSMFPDKTGKNGYSFENYELSGFQEIVQKGNKLGTLYLKSNMVFMYQKFALYGQIALLVIFLSASLAYLLSLKLQHIITGPILELANTAKAVSNKHDYSIRATKLGNDEIGFLTDAFNKMLVQIQTQDTEIHSFNQQLEKKIAERTLELEAANKELESFSYSVSHDLRAPLRAMDGFSKMLLKTCRDKLNTDEQTNLDSIRRNVKQMAKLIDDLLSFSKTAKKNMVKTNLNMENITQKIVHEQEVLQQKKVIAKIETLLPAKGDASMITQVITNLVSNAIKYSSKQKNPKIEIGSYQHQNYNVYYVKDNGVGFDMRYYDKLFGVFQRLHSGRYFEGTGIGLAIVQRIINKHGGKVWAEGKVDEGASFYFSLPIESANEDRLTQKHFNNKKIHFAS